MNNRGIISALAAILIVSTGSVLAQDGKEAEVRKVLPLIQEQLDALREGEQRLIKEIEELKKLLQEKPGRADYAANPAMPNIIPVNVHGEPFKGDGRARVAIMEYSDFDCSFCAKYAREIYPLIDEDYVKAGRIKYFFRDLPAREHTNALAKARAARCAGEQGKFWEMHDRLFADQSASAGPDFTSHAQALELDTKKFNECLSGGRYVENIQLSVAGAKRIGILGTPAFLIGTVTEDGDFMRATKVLLGAEKYETFKSILDELLGSQSEK